MKPFDTLRSVLQSIDGKDYGAYQSLLGTYRHPAFELRITQIPKDPYAPPHTGMYCVVVNRDQAGFPSDCTSNRIRSIAFRDYLARMFFENCHVHCKGRRGTGNSGVITIAEPLQEILDRTSVVVNDVTIEVRFFIGLPATKRSIRSDIAQTMFFEELPAIIQNSLYAANLDLADLQKHIETAEDAEFLRNQLAEHNLVSFLADGSILPRASGVDPSPLKRDNAICFTSPETMQVSFTLPNHGPITGMGIPTGVTLIVGGGYHGKSTLLDAVSLGVYNHIPGDGREFCVTSPGAVKVRAFSGRSVRSTDISAFINNIPGESSTESFTTENASGSTSQAASIAEMIEVGADVLLMDEDTCAANFMIRDRRMQQLVAKANEPITAFVDVIRLLYTDHNISTVLVMGGSGDYFDVCDTVIQMTNYVPSDVTTEAKEVAQNNPTGRLQEGGHTLKLPSLRIPSAENINPHNEYGGFRINTSDREHLIFGSEKINCSDLEQLVEPEQVKAIGRAIFHISEAMNSSTSIQELLNAILKDISESGLDLLDQRFTGDLSKFRIFELAGVLNRMRSLKCNTLF